MTAPAFIHPLRNTIAAGSEPVPPAIHGGKLAASAGRLRRSLAHLPAAFSFAAIALVVSMGLAFAAGGPECLSIDAALARADAAGFRIAATGRTAGGFDLLHLLAGDGRFALLVIEGGGENTTACLVTSGSAWTEFPPDEDEGPGAVLTTSATPSP